VWLIVQRVVPETGGRIGHDVGRPDPPLLHRFGGRRRERVPPPRVVSVAAAALRDGPPTDAQRQRADAGGPVGAVAVVAVRVPAAAVAGAVADAAFTLSGGG